MLAAAGVAHAQTKPAFTPTKRGGGGTVKVLWWQSPTLLNPHFANGTKDQDGSRIFYEPLASFDPDGNLFPNLAAEVPTVQNGGIAKDGTSVTWKLKRNVQWHDGKPFTADDVVFNWEYATDPATAAVTAGAFPNVTKVEKVDASHGQGHLQSAPAVPVHGALRARRARSSPSTSSSRSRVPSRARRRPTSSLSAPARTGTWTSSRVTWSGPS